MKKSSNLYNEACKYIPGGVNSPVRAFRSVGGKPVFIERGKGSKIWDIDGNEYIDFVLSWGPLILGHAEDRIVNAVKEIVEKGSSFGAPTKAEVDIARLIVEMVPSIEKVRMVNSGTEATMSAIRLARAYTGRDKIVKFNGCYHGHGDSFLIKTGSGSLTYSLPSSPGVTKCVTKNTIIAEYNDLENIKKIFLENKGEISSVIIEPIAGNMGLVLPEMDFLTGLREITKEEGSLLIFDEVITGFRVSKGGAQEYFGITPDITTLGKIIGGGFPVGAFGGRSEIMNILAPDGPVYQAGTLSGNPVAMIAGYHTLKILKENPDIYNYLDKLGEKLEDGILDNIKISGAKGVQFERFGSLSCLFFNNNKVKNAIDALNSNTKRYSVYFKEMIKRGIYIAPSQFEVSFLSSAHGRDDIENFIKANYSSLKTVFD
ncbi:MAG: glutamate-1-semialdehyde 2,1-aminomutase [Deltaproteobacteria bacterium]|nr:glutamate-1-semialdehyde 2,1-aminomutase [Deltaproteobacteria bacterium]